MARRTRRLVVSRTVPPNEIAAATIKTERHFEYGGDNTNKTPGATAREHRVETLRSCAGAENTEAGSLNPDIARHDVVGDSGPPAWRGGLSAFDMQDVELLLRPCQCLSQTHVRGVLFVFLFLLGFSHRVLVSCFSPFVFFRLCTAPASVS